MQTEAKDRVIFLGAAERASLVHDRGTSIPKWNLLGLKNILVVNFLPINLSGWHWVFALLTRTFGSGFKIRFVHAGGEELGSLTIGVGQGTAIDPLNQQVGETREMTLLLPLEGYTVAAFRLPMPLIADKPGQYRVLLSAEGYDDELVGTFDLAVVDPPPLTPEKIAAFKADPNAAKAARAEIGCKHCSTKLRVYTALEKNTKLEAQGYIWFEQIEDQFKCECGKTFFDLTSMKRNFFSILGSPRLADEDEAEFEPLYQESSIANVRTELLKLLERVPREEELQKFIQDNLILLHQFPSDRIFFKPPILTFFRADFCLVTAQKELILIEIERASMRLLRKNGDESADLGHAINQITRWLHIVDEHRLAVLDSLEIDRSAVSVVRGVVIAGRDRGNDAEHLRRLKGVDRGRVSLLTYDDIAFSLLSLAKRMRSL